MKKYKTLNFLEDNKYDFINKLALFSVLVFIFLNLLIHLINLKELKSEIVNSETQKITTNKVEKIKEVDTNNIKLIYSMFGPENIDEMKLSNENIEVRGKCSDLNLLYDIEDVELIKNASVDGIKKEENYYMFRLEYQAR
ncbi:hypothetical protein QOZ84_08485 [Romboutsia sedimentorum]|uniref:Uncharacterized protein n=1 Tax=Romboutsia sedimentorum TaxID=1368474 RepID=A0ABT7E9H9_9FIRM|nr:hypothetical protein [Romboutsia sedimentorum]MDK2563585.1 hypothetical protein [Romboutsia sedimentorum]